MPRYIQGRGPTLVGVGMYGTWFRVTPNEIPGVLSRDDEGVDAVVEDGVRARFDVGKSWHGLHVVLTGSPGWSDHSLADVVLGGVPIGKDHGYGPARLQRPEMVRSLANDLATLGERGFARAIDFQRLEQLDPYPSGTWTSPGDQPVRYKHLKSCYITVRDGYAAAASSGAALLVLIA